MSNKNKSEKQKLRTSNRAFAYARDIERQWGVSSTGTSSIEVLKNGQKCILNVLGSLARELEKAGLIE